MILPITENEFEAVDVLENFETMRSFFFTKLHQFKFIIKSINFNHFVIGAIVLFAV